MSRPLERFLRIEAASGITLLIAAAAALLWANSPWAAGYTRLWHMPVGVRVGAFAFERPLEWFVNDCLMVLFFFVVGMEIRRELHHGELSTWRRAALPVVAALGGMLVPAGLYLAVAGAAPTASGWGVPMATDIAFAIGILALLGKRIPSTLRVLLLALAVMDDLGAIVVIALFYSSGVTISGILVAVIGLGGVLAMQRLGVRVKLAYVVPGIVVWAGIYMAGIHPTIAGVVLGLVTPVRAWLGPEGFLLSVRVDIEKLAKASSGALRSRELAGTLHRIEVARREAISPAESLIEKLQPLVAYGVMPVFALANAGVSLSGAAFDGGSWRVVVGVAVGLVVGKPLGVLLASFVALRLRIAALPSGLGLRHVLVLGLAAGIGFTMALFIAQLAFMDGEVLSAAKLGVLAASGIASVLGVAVGWLLLAPPKTPAAEITADEAEGLQ